jgi:hypothetical protein
MKVVNGRVKASLAAAFPPTVGRNWKVDSGRASRRPLIPPTVGVWSTNQANTIVPIIARLNCTKSPTTTPHSPEIEEYAPVKARLTSTAVKRFHPIVTSKIFAMAKFTQPIMRRLIGKPR